MVFLDHFRRGGGGGGGRPDCDWEPLVRRIMAAAEPELARLRERMTLLRQIDLWSRWVLPIAAGLIMVFGSLLVWAEQAGVLPDSDSPLLAEIVVPEGLDQWLQSDEELTLHELVEVLEGDEG